MEPKYYSHTEPFELECGGVLPRLTIAYHTFGENRGDNAVWVCHALTANSDVANWWPGTVEEGKFLDPARWFVVCANIIGSPYGTTGPMSVDPATGEKYYGDFPLVTMRDIARANLLLANHLGINQARAVVGGSIGGFQALEMELLQPGFARRLVLLATGAKATPWNMALNESQRMAIRADGSFGERRDDAGRQGLAAARSIALLSYRGPAAYGKTQRDKGSRVRLRGEYPAVTYQRYQGEKFVKRFDAYSYMTIAAAFDSYNVGLKSRFGGEDRGGIARALGRIECPALIVSISTDIVIPPEEQKELARYIKNSERHTIESPFGHDGFLVEHRKLNELIQPFIIK